MRDGQTQTIPYSPDPIIHGNKKPEVVSETLLKMKFYFYVDMVMGSQQALMN